MSTSTDFNIQVKSAHPFDNTIALLKEAILAKDLLLIHEINVQQIVSRFGVESEGLYQLLFFHPRYMQQVLARNNKAVIEAPLKIVIMQTGTSEVHCNYIKPSYLFGRYADLEVLGQDLEQIIQKIIATIV
jgi:uncharacterized protein (DUF302 family)